MKLMIFAVAAAHLYNAIHSEDPSFPDWVDIKALTYIHTTYRIFWRDYLPRNPYQYAQSYDRATGVNDMLAQRDQGSNAVIKPRNVEQRGIGKSYPTMLSFEVDSRHSKTSLNAANKGQVRSL